MLNQKPTSAKGLGVELEPTQHPNIHDHEALLHHSRSPPKAWLTKRGGAKTGLNKDQQDMTERSLRKLA